MYFFAVCLLRISVQLISFLLLKGRQTPLSNSESVG